MNPRQKKFCKLYLSGMPAGRAYEQAGYDATGNTAEMAASRLIRNDKVKNYLKTMNQKADDDTIASIQERKQTLTEIMRKFKLESPPDAIRASAELSKMDGGYEPERQEMDINITIGGNADS